MIGVRKKTNGTKQTKGLGIFAPPLPVLKSKSNDKLSQTSRSTPNLHFGQTHKKRGSVDKTPLDKYKLEENSEKEKYREEDRTDKYETSSLPPISEKSETPLTTPSLSLVPKHPTMVSQPYLERQSTSNMQSCSPRLQKAISLPVIPLGGTSDWTAADDISEYSASSGKSDSSGTPRGEEELCDPQVISEITKTLPMSLMIRANQNVNKVVYDKKKKLIQKSKKIAEREVVSDPRYLALQNSLTKTKGD